MIRNELCILTTFRITKRDLGFREGKHTTKKCQYLLYNWKTDFIVLLWGWGRFGGNVRVFSLKHCVLTVLSFTHGELPKVQACSTLSSNTNLTFIKKHCCRSSKISDSRLNKQNIPFTGNARFRMNYSSMLWKCTIL